MNNPFDPYQAGEQDPYQNQSPYASNPYQQQQFPRNSAMAVLSLVLAIISPFMICLCIPSLVASLGAVVLGHTALYRISRSNGQLTGRSPAIIALILGYPVALISGALLAVAILGGQDERQIGQGPEVDAPPTAASEMGAAEIKIISAGEGMAYGNTEEAKVLAETYSLKMKQMREWLFTEGEDHAISLTDGEFVTYCELREDRCVFLVHVPDYRRFEDDAKASLAELAWEAAQDTVDGVLSTGDQLGVGLKGVLLYGSVMTGTVGTGEVDEVGEPEYSGDDKDMLLPFFEPEAMDTEEDVSELKDDISTDVDANLEPDTDPEVNLQLDEDGE